MKAQETGEAFLINHYNHTVFGEDYDFNDINFTKNGLMYLASSKGIIEFDGKQWQLISVENEKVNALATDSSSRVYFLSESKFGFIKRDEFGHSETRFLNTMIEQNIADFRRIHIINGTVYFISSKYLVKYLPKDNLIDVIDSDDRILDSYVIGQKLYLRSKKKGFSEFRDDKLITINKSRYFTSLSAVYNVLKLDKRRYLFSRLSRLYILNGKKVTELQTNISNELRKHIIADGLFLHNGELFIPTLTGGLFHLSVNGRLIKIYNKGNHLVDDAIIRTKIDYFGNLWLLHKNNFSRLGLKDHFLQLSQYEGISGKINDIKHYKGRNYFAGEEGVYLKQNGIYKQLNKRNENASSFFAFRKKLYVTMETGVYEVSSGKLKRISKLQAQNAIPSQKNKSMIYTGSSIGFAYLKKGKRRFTEQYEDKIKDHITAIIEESSSIIWLNTSASGVLRLIIGANGLVDRVQKFEPVADDNLQRRSGLHLINQNVFYVTNKDIYIFNIDSNRFEMKQEFKSKYEIMPVKYVPLKDNKYIYSDLRKIIYNGKNKFNYIGFEEERLHKIINDEQSNIWLLTENKVFHHLGESSYDDVEQKLLIRKVTYRSNDTDSLSILKSGINAELPYENNYFRINFSVPDFSGLDKYRYQYRVVGKDDNWSRFTDEDYLEFKNLNDNEYYLLLRAKNLRTNSLYLNEITFLVVSPFWKKWWFYVFLLMLLIFGINLLVKYRMQAIEKRNKYLQSLVKERTKELAEKNDSLNDALEELKDTQAQLIHAEKMSSLGQMIAGIAHEMNTPLGSVKNNLFIINQISQNLYQKFKDALNGEFDSGNQVLFGRIKDSETGIDRISEIVKGLRDFSKIDDVSFLESGIAKLIDETLRVAKPVLQENNIEVVKNIKDDIKIFCNASQINQVFLNIVRNACQSMANVGDERRKLEIACHKKSNLLTISIKDFGLGIPDNIKDKIFDPFFTTREIGKGTGLGLATAYSIMKEHKGKIYFDSKVDEGSTFYIEFNINELSTIKENLGLKS